MSGPSNPKGKETLSQRFLEAYLDAFSDMIFLISPDNTYLDFHGSTQNLYVSPEEFLGQPLQKTMPDEVVAVVEPVIASARESGEIKQSEYTLNIGSKTAYFLIFIFVLSIHIRNFAAS